MFPLSKIAAVTILATIMLLKNNDCELIGDISKSYDDLISCILDVLDKHYSQFLTLTYFNMNTEDNGITKAINEKSMIPIIYRQGKKRMIFTNEGYLGHINNVTDLEVSYSYYIKEAAWNPYAPVIIIVQSLELKDLPRIFDIFLSHYVTDVVVINGTNDADVYSYDPYENYGCGKRYERIIRYGKCMESNANWLNIKSVKSLENCTLNVSAPHWPPFSVDLNKHENNNILGIEQFIMKTVAGLEKFEVNFINNYDAEEFSTVSSDMLAIGPMDMLQAKEVDVILGGMMLIKSRALAFCYVYGHLAYLDELGIIVKMASVAPAWKNVYLEFTITAWGLLVLAFIIYFAFLSTLYRVHDKSKLALTMLGFLISQGVVFRYKSKYSLKIFIVCWIWFTFLINSFYQSSLVSLNTNPTKNYQITDEEDIAKNKIKPCLSSVITSFIFSQTGHVFPGNNTPECQSFLGSIREVSKSEDLYSIIISSRYNFEKHKFYDHLGNSLVYYFPKVYSKIIYAIYLNKGFPFCNSLHYRTLQLRENGLVDKYLNDIYYEQIRKKFHCKIFQSRFAIPWIVYINGCIASALVFIVEIVSDSQNDRKKRISTQNGNI